MLISIVANFYKSGRFIPKLLKSVFAQTYQDWELICVVDASPDDDVRIIKQQVSKHKMEGKVRIIENKKNIGISRSKKVGIDAANGKYITFIDGDDFFAPQALEKMSEPALKYDVDYVNMNYCRYYAPIRKRVDICVPLKTDEYERVMYKDEFFDRCFINFFGGYFIGLAYWAKLYRTSMLKHLDFEYPEQGDTVAEDKWFNMEVYQHINTAYFVPYVGYYWRWGGITSVRIDESWSVLNDLKKHIDYFDYQKSLIDRYDYQKAWLPLLNNLKGKFIETFSQISKYKCLSTKAIRIKEQMSVILDSEPFRHFKGFTASSAMSDLDTAVIANDVNRVYSLMHAIYKRDWKLRWGRKMAQRLFYFLR